MRRWAPLALAFLAMTFFAARAAAWQLAEDATKDTHLTPFGEKLYLACLVLLPLLPAIALFVLLFTKRASTPSVLTAVLLLVLGVAGVGGGVWWHWPLFSLSAKSSLLSPDGTKEAHLFTGGLFCSAMVCVAEPRALWCEVVADSSNVKCGTETIGWSPEGTAQLVAESSPPLDLFPH